jgi:c-di-GMP-binding flagellar brake protein YcgR
MGLKSLVLCSDEKIVRVLRRVLGDLEIDVELAANSDIALRKLTRQRFEAIVVDFTEEGAAEVLGSARSAPCNKHAVAIAVVDPAITLKFVFGVGAHFVLYKPVSIERAKSTFRAARALMKSERRRNVRVAVQIPVGLTNPTTKGTLDVKTLDLSEGGMAVSVAKNRKRPSGTWQIRFTLPGTDSALALMAEFAWEGSKEQAGLRFLQVSPEASLKLREWLKRNSPDAEPDDPPIRCQLTDLSLAACYLEVSSPFPVRSRVTISMRAAGVEVKVQGVVRVMHPDKGMGVEFTQATPEDRGALEKFLATLTENATLQPELLVQPEGLESDAPAGKPASGEFEDDPLLNLFYGEPLAPEAFHEELRKQRAVPAETKAVAAAQS